VVGNRNQVATTGGIIAGNVTGGIIVTGGGNNLRLGKDRGW
jgi:hypothetical protein